MGCGIVVSVENTKWKIESQNATKWSYGLRISNSLDLVWCHVVMYAIMTVKASGIPCCRTDRPVPKDSLYVSYGRIETAFELQEVQGWRRNASIVFKGRVV
jgi:hypothetical protein